MFPRVRSQTTMRCRDSDLNKPGRTLDRTIVSHSMVLTTYHHNPYSRYQKRGGGCAHRIGALIIRGDHIMALIRSMRERYDECGLDCTLSNRAVYTRRPDLLPYRHKNEPDHRSSGKVVSGCGAWGEENIGEAHKNHRHDDSDCAPASYVHLRIESCSESCLVGTGAV